jgi:type I restriction enzyme S subunit
LANISIPLPPLAEQKEITKILDGVDAKLGVLALKQSSFQTLKRGLMQKLLTGEWRVRVETAVPAGEAAVTA